MPSEGATVAGRRSHWRRRRTDVRSFERRLRTGFNIVVIPVGASGVMLLVALLILGGGQSRLAAELDSELAALSTLRSDIDRAAHQVELFAATGDSEAVAEYRVLERAIERDLAAIEEFDEASEVEHAAAARASWEAGKRDAEEVFASEPGQPMSDAFEVVDAFTRVADHVAEVDEMSREDLASSARGWATTTANVAAIAVLIGVAATIVNINLVRRLLNATLGPLRHLTDGVSRLSVDDLSHRIEPMGDSEFREVGEAFNTMAGRLQDTVASLEHQAFHDSLTGLPNRAALLRHLRAEAPDGRWLVLFDLDDFKGLNDGLGHAAGDAALIQVTRRLSESTRPGDFLARLGGDEFVVVLDGVTADHVEQVALHIGRQIARPTEVAGRAVVLHASGGIAPATGDPATVLRSADVALYVAKASGKDGVQLFQPAMLGDVEARLDLETDLRLALDRGEISIHYQPTVATVSGSASGVEALMRWNHPTRGFVPPVEFIPVAESSGQILALGRFVLDGACRQAKAWQQLPGLEQLSVNVNVSAAQLHSHDIVSDVARALARSGLAASNLTIEVTESVMADPHAVDLVHKIKELGVRIALDDFGTGYSSMSYLQRLPIDVVKIDKTFIDDIDHRADRAVFANAIVQLAHSLGLQTVAEGVEEPGQLRVLEGIGCDVVQGYLFARPEASRETETRLLELANSRGTEADAGSSRRVRVTIGPLDSAAAKDWLTHAHWALDEMEAGRLVPEEVPSAVVAMMRDYVHRWTIAAMNADAFVWDSDEDAELLRLMMSRWVIVSSALAERSAQGADLLSPAAGEFSEALAHGILVALTANGDGDDAVRAATLAQQWPSHDVNDGATS